MADEPQPKNPERFFRREQIFRQHPAVRDMPRLSDALKDTDKQGNVPLAAHEALAREAAIQKGEVEGETHYGRIRRLNNEWNEQYPVHREHRVELTPWEEKPYNERALHHHQFGIPNGGGAISSHHDELRVTLQSYKNDDGSTGHYSKLEQVPEGQSIVEAVGHALGEHPAAMDARLSQRTGGEYPKDFNKPDRRAVMKEFGYNAAKQLHAEDPDPFNRTRRN